MPETKYTITYLEDLAKIPADRLAYCLSDLGAAISRGIIHANSKIRNFVWVDDGKDEAGVYCEELPKTPTMIDTTTQQPVPSNDTPDGNITNQFIVQNLNIPAGLSIIHLKILRDERGFFTVRFSNKAFQELGFPTYFEQINHSRSEPGTVRGLHFQRNPDQGKLISVISGRVWYVAVDIRPDSPSFGGHYGIELNCTKMFWIPPGFAHGFCVLGDKPADMVYYCDGEYNPQGEGGILWYSPELNIPWPILSEPVVSLIDNAFPRFDDFVKNNPFVD